MMRRRLRGIGIGGLLAIAGVGLAPAARGQAGAVGSMDDLVRMTPQQLDALYAAAPPAPMPAGKVRGRAIVRPGSRMAVPLSRGARVLWQGKVFRPEDGTAVNRFFGVRAVRGELSQGPSWRDGRPALILDYSRTSRVYAPYRDEIREVAPGLYLGLMYDRRTPRPALKMYFALDARPRSG